MKKSLIRVSCLALAATMALSLVACKKEQKNDTETRPVVFATDAADGKFNPFFATSATDSEMVGMTQLGMLTTDENGNPIAGENEATVALSYDITTEGEGENKFTTYEFVIKNGIKFSDGSDLTIKDVLFNLYVYLDPSYMGSATMYSTDIVGLADYRAQERNTQITDSELNTKFDGAAYTRSQDIVYYLDGDSSTNPTRDEKAIKADIETLKSLFKEEVTTDWTANQGGLDGYKDEYTFTEDWQVYYLNEGIIDYVYNSQGKRLREKPTEYEADGVTLKPGKYVTTITPKGVTLDDDSTYDGGSYRAEIVEGVKNAQADTAKIQAYVAGGASEADAISFVTRDYATNYVYEAYTVYSGDLINILNYWASGANLMDKFVAEARTAYFEDLKSQNNGEMEVPNITGITTEKREIKGVLHDVLKIKINGVDPKAIYNFAFAVAPMSYYSGTLDDVNYIELAMNDTTNSQHFGVAFNNNKFFETILQADYKNAKPVGAGAYQVSNQKGDVGEEVKGSDFYSNNWLYFARNDYFTTVGDKIENAKIKFVRYKVVNSENIIESLRTGEIDVGEPNATQENMALIKDIKHLAQRTVETNGYGYVGINPKYVPDYYVRKAIMSVMDTKHCLDYYSDKYADLIYRSMSKSSWVWKNEDMPTEAYYELTLDKTAIQEMVALDGWYPTGAGGKLQKNGKTLKLTFTIAGATTDHPAFTMFTEAAKNLNDYGFDITVTKDIGALQKLATGGLEVWAAAWSSTVDPDMYQVYHKDSNASSIKNWGYETIMNGSDADFGYEKGIIEELSALIEQGRDVNDQATRSAIYVKALDKVMDLAVEMPTYQRNDCVAYNKNVISEKSLNAPKTTTAYAGVIDKIWELDYV